MAPSEVTVVVPTMGNRPSLLASTLRSVASQVGLAGVEVLVVDASGQDLVRGTDAVIRGVTVLAAEERLTAGGARQLGTIAASTEWIAYCDDDDLWAPLKLARQVEAVGGDEVGWCFTGAVSFKTHEGVSWATACQGLDDLRRTLLERNCVPGGGSSCLVRRNLIEEAGGWDLALRNSEDWDMWIRLSRISRAAYVHAPLVGYRLHDTSKSLDVSRIRASHESIRSKHCDEGIPLPPLDWMYRRELLTGRLKQARKVYDELPEKTWSSRILRTLSSIDAERTAAWLLAREAKRAPLGWLEEARSWISTAEPPQTS